MPSQLLRSSNPLSASIVIGSFGFSKPYKSRAFDLIIKGDPGSQIVPAEKPLRYGQLPEINHIFKGDPKSPPTIISIAFAAIVIAALPVLFVSVCALQSLLDAR